LDNQNNKKFPKKILIIITSIFILTGIIFTTYYITSNSTNSKYINALYDQKKLIDDINENVGSSIKQLDKFDSTDTTELESLLTAVVKAESSIEKSIEELKKIAPPAKYQEQYTTYMKGITFNKRIFTQTKLILQNSTSSSIGNAVDALYKYVSDATQAYELSKLGKSYLSLPSEIVTLPDKVGEYALEVFNNHEVKSRLLEQYTSYFNDMYRVNTDFENVKIDLEDNLSLIQSNNISMEGVYTDIEKRLSRLSEIQTSYNSLTVPPKLVEGHQKFNEIINTYTYYCNDYKSALIKLENAGSDFSQLEEAGQIFTDLDQKYREISNVYREYIETFNENHTFYTDINNL
jgi:hypothetical protein